MGPNPEKFFWENKFNPSLEKSLAVCHVADFDLFLRKQYKITEPTDT